MPSEENLLDPVLVALGQRLLDARLDYGRRQRPIRSVTQVEIGRALDVSGVTVGNWEAGKNDPGVPMLNKLAELYGVNDVWLMTGKGKMRDENDEGGQGAENPNPAPAVSPATPRKVPIISSKYIPTRKERERAEREKPKRRKPGALRQTG